jgi:hypothetical protein
MKKNFISIEYPVILGDPKIQQLADTDKIVSFYVQFNKEDVVTLPTRDSDVVDGIERTPEYFDKDRNKAIPMQGDY